MISANKDMLSLVTELSIMYPGGHAVVTCITTCIASFDGPPSFPFVAKVPMMLACARTVLCGKLNLESHFNVW